MDQNQTINPTETKMSVEDLLRELSFVESRCGTNLSNHRVICSAHVNGDDDKRIKFYKEVIDNLDELCEASEQVISYLESQYPDELCIDDEEEEDEDSEPYVTKLVKERKQKEKKEKAPKTKCSFVLISGKAKGQTCKSNAVKDSNLCSKHNK